MAHYAFLDENNIVVEVIVGIDETELIEGLDTETWYGNFRGKTCKRTSYNTADGVHRENKIPFRKNYAGIGYSYSETLDAFIPPKPYPSWTLDEEKCKWNSPVAYPNPDPENPVSYIWNEELLNWQGVSE
jgi:hypothetical protein